MTDKMTPLDIAHQAMAEAPESDTARMRFYERLADTEMFLLLEKESDGDSIEPQIFPLEDGPVVLVFDHESRLADFMGKPSDYAGLSGRQIVKLLAGQGIGLGVNLGVAACETVLPAQALDWLADVLDHRPEATEDTPREVSAPGAVPETLLAGLDSKLASAAGLASTVYLASVTYEGGRNSHMLAFIGAAPGAENALAAAAGEALTFSGLDAGEMDVAFLAASDPLAARLSRVGLRFELPEPPEPEVVELDPPGMNPDEPPILR